MNRAQRRLVRVTLVSLAEEPDAWTTDEYEARNKALGIRVWLSNGRWGLDITGFDIRVGGVVGMALAPWRYRVYLAADCVRQRKAFRELGHAELYACYLKDRHKYADRPGMGLSGTATKVVPLRSQNSQAHAHKWRWPDFEAYAPAPEAVRAWAEADPECSWSAEKASRFLFDNTHNLRHCKYHRHGEHR